MNDSIISCIKCTDATGNVDHYDVSFSFSNLGSLPFTPIVTLKSSDLQNSNDLNEVKAKACTQATQLKALYVYQNSLVYSKLTDLNGPVTL
jgi:hypothetical protein